jgi:hypothetical protein
MKTPEYILLLCLIGVIVVAGNSVGYDINFISALPGMAILCAIVACGFLLGQAPVLNKLPVIFWVSISAIVASTILPGSEQVLAYTKQVQFLAICTPILAYAGLSVGKDLEMFKKLSWRIIPVAAAVFTGTFLAATALAQLTLHWEGVI